MASALLRFTDIFSFLQNFLVASASLCATAAVPRVPGGKRTCKELWTVEKVGESEGGRNFEAQATIEGAKKKRPRIKSCGASRF